MYITILNNYLAIVFKQLQFNIFSNFTMIRVLKSFNHLFPCLNATFQKRSVEYNLAGTCPFKFIVSFDHLHVKNENVKLLLCYG